MLKYLEWLYLGEQRKIEKSKLCKHRGEVPPEDLFQIFSFDFFFTGSGYSESEFAEESYKQIQANIQNLLAQRDAEYVKIVAEFVGIFFETNTYIDRVYIDTLLSILSRGTFTPDVTVRFRTITEVISSQTIRQNIEHILAATHGREDLKTYIKKELEIWAKQTYRQNAATLIQQIRAY